MRPSRPATLIIHTTSKKALKVRFQPNPGTLNARPALPVLPPTITKLDSSSMKHLFLFLFDTGDSIKASASDCWNSRASVEMSENVTLPYQKARKHLTFFSSLSLSSPPPEILNKQDLYLWPRNASKSTCLLGRAGKCRAQLAA